MYDLEERVSMDEINYSDVNKSLDELRKKSMSYLQLGLDLNKNYNL